MISKNIKGQLFSFTSTSAAPAVPSEQPESDRTIDEAGEGCLSMMGADLVDGELMAEITVSASDALWKLSTAFVMRKEVSGEASGPGGLYAPAVHDTCKRIYA